jgi:hypothetical protein
MQRWPCLECTGRQDPLSAATTTTSCCRGGARPDTCTDSVQVPQVRIAQGPECRVGYLWWRQQCSSNTTTVSTAGRWRSSSGGLADVVCRTCWWLGRSTRSAAADANAAERSELADSGRERIPDSGWGELELAECECDKSQLTCRRRLGCSSDDWGCGCRRRRSRGSCGWKRLVSE